MYAYVPIYNISASSYKEMREPAQQESGVNLWQLRLCSTPMARWYCWMMIHDELKAEEEEEELHL
jgi:hypothetical protein